MTAKDQKKNVSVIELFSGIGGFSKGIEQAGYDIDEHYFSEVDKHAIANYKYNFPNAKYIGDVKSIRTRDFRGIDIITFGSPCQDFSLAGRRKGLEGERSSLIEYAIKLITDIRPSVFIWENVKGAFSSNNGKDFWAILQAFANIGGYRLEWQLLNTKWFLPQNRERIYLVGHLAERSKLGIFPIKENDFLPREEAKSKKGWPQTKDYSTTLGASGATRASDTFIKLPKIAKCLTAGGNSGGLHSDMATIMAGAIRGRNPQNPKSRTKGQITEQVLEVNNKGVTNTITSVQKDNVIIRLGRGKNKGGDKDLSPTITANSFEHNNFLKIGTWRTHNDGNGFRQVKDGNCPTIPARAREDGSGQPVISDDGINIRRLTEIECERLQGFPDDWTKFGNYDGIVKETPKTQRYKLCGNAVTVRVVEEIAKRLKLT